MGSYAMPRYFQHMPAIGQPLTAADDANRAALQKVEDAIAQKRQDILDSGKPTAALNEKGQLCAMQRIKKLVDEGTFLPLNSLFDPYGNETGSTGVVKGLGKVGGKWVVIAASDNKKLAGAWVPGQPENMLRAADAAKRLRIPLVCLFNCSGVKLDRQEDIFPGRNGGGALLYRNAALNQAGVPVIAGMYGTNLAGGGYQGITPTVILAQKSAHMAVGGSSILGGMEPPRGLVDESGAASLIAAQAHLPKEAPGSMAVHHDATGFVREVYGTEEEVIAGIREYIGYLPAYAPEFFRVAAPQEPTYPADDLYSLLPFDQHRTYDIRQIVARLVDGSAFAEYRPDYGPEVIAGTARLNGLPVAIAANVQGFFLHYPDYRKDSFSVGGKLYRQGLIKLSEFVGLCVRDRLPIIWMQDTTGVDIGDDAERSELLGLGQSLIYTIQQSDLPMLEVTLRKGAAAAHYVMGGPQGQDTNAFSIGTAATEVCVMHAQTGAAAMYGGKLAKDSAAGKPLEPTIDKMNAMIEDYAAKSAPAYCAQKGMVDEIAALCDLRPYLLAFTEAAYQNPVSLCPVHQMLLSRVMAEQGIADDVTTLL